jgi:hypothetical protein
MKTLKDKEESKKRNGRIKSIRVDLKQMSAYVNPDDRGVNSPKIKKLEKELSELVENERKFNGEPAKFGRKMNR